MSRRKKQTSNLPMQLSKKEKLALAYQELARLRLIDRETIAVCARQLNVSERTINNYLATDEYQKAVEELRTNSRESAMSRVADLSDLAITTLKDLMEHDKSGHVRFEAAKEILDKFGLGFQPEDMQQQDDHEELDRLTRLLAARPQVTIYQQHVEPGGFLPQALRPDQPIDADYLAAKLRPQIVEGKLVENTPPAQD